MKPQLKVTLEVLLCIVLYLLIQVLCRLLFGFLRIGTAYSILLSQFSAALITIVLFLATHWSKVYLHYIYSAERSLWLWLLLLSAALIIPLESLQEQFSFDIPKVYTQELQMLCSHSMGFFVVAIFAPCVEEIVFRGAILGKLLSLKFNKWYAILISALVFAIIHGNFAQGVNAMIMGLLLGWMYARTLSILPSLLVHCTNNTIAFMSIKIYSDNPDVTLMEIFKGNELFLCISIVVSFVVAILSLWRINLAMKT